MIHQHTGPRYFHHCSFVLGLSSEFQHALRQGKSGATEIRCLTTSACRTLSNSLGSSCLGSLRLTAFPLVTLLVWVEYQRRDNNIVCSLLQHTGRPIVVIGKCMHTMYTPKNIHICSRELYPQYYVCKIL